jgi:hydrogenase nickel incorporation protein HypB
MTSKRTPRRREIAVVTDLLGANDEIAAQNAELLRRHGVFTVNMMSSPGAGKTTLLEQTLKHFRGRAGTAVIEGDICGTYDVDRLKGLGAQLVQINTSRFGGECHLEANMIRNAVAKLDLGKVKLLFIENVGNLVCPAEFNLGEAAKVAVLSVTEGDDKPAKYPLMFRICDLLVLSKTDLIPHTNFSAKKFHAHVKRINPRLGVVEASAVSGEGMSAWYEWLARRIPRGPRK